MKKIVAAILVMVLLVSLSLKPARAETADGMFVSVSSQMNSTLALDYAGRIWAWGSNVSGQFGDGTTSDSYSPRLVSVMEGGNQVSFKDVKTTLSSSLALDSAGQLWATGSNGYGLGLGSATTETLSWTKLEVTDGGTPVVFKKIAVTRATSFALDSNGQLWVWGFRSYNSDSFVPEKKTITDGTGDSVSFEMIDANDENVVALDASQRIWSIFYPQYNPYLVDGTGEVKFQSVAAGSAYGTGTGSFLSLAIDTDGNLWSWGGNDYGQLGDGQTSDANTYAAAEALIEDNGTPVKFTQVSGGLKHVLALDDNGDLWSWGLNDAGQLGDGTTTASAPHKIELSDNGASLRFESVTAGYHVSYGIDADGQIWSWGAQNLLGDNTSGSSLQTTPEKIYIKPAMSLAISAASSTYLEPVTLSATVRGDFDVPSGTVEFKAGGVSLGNAAIGPDGTAVLAVSSLAVGSHNITAYYGGDDIYLAGASNTLIQTVVMPAAPAITVTPSAADETTGPVTLTVSAVTYGAGNSLSVLKWLAGDYEASAFATDGTDITATGTFDAADNGPYTVYAKDLAGNETVETVMISNIVPPTSVLNPTSASFDKYAKAAGHKDVATNVTLNGNTLTRISNGAFELTQGTDYTVAGQTVHILRTYLEMLPEGLASLTFTFSKGPEQTLAVTITDSTPRSVSPGKSSVTATPLLVRADGSSEGLITAVLKGEDGEPIQNREIQLVPDGGSSVTADTYGMTDSTGSYTYSVTDTAAETVTYTIIETENGTEIEQKASITFVYNQPPSITLTSDPLASTYGSVTISVTASVYGRDNAVAVSKWAEGTRGQSYFAELGTDIENNRFTVDENGTYSVYVKDTAGNENIAVITVGNILDSGTSTSSKDDDDLSGNARLKSLRLSGGDGLITLDPAFKPEITAYTAETAAASINITAASDKKAEVDLALNGKAVSAKRAELEAGDNVLEVTVTAEDGKEKTYEVTIRRTAAADAADTEKTLTDIGGHWAEELIRQAVDSNMAKGYPDGTFRPDRAVTRSEYAVMLMNALGMKPSGTAAGSFKDQEQIAAWASDAVAAAVQAGIVSGYTDGTFRPNAYISRSEMAVMTAKALALTADGTAAEGFADAAEVPEWAADAVEALHEAGIVNGRSGNRFMPNEAVTRAEAVVMLLRQQQLTGSGQ